VNQPFNEYEIDCFRRAGRIISEVREWAKTAIAPGVEMRVVLETVEDMIRERGAEPGFPAQSSRNSTAAHYCTSPKDATVYQEGDCVKIDIGAHIDGYVVDTAATVDLSNDGRWVSLIQASDEALGAAIKQVKDGVPTGTIGAVIERKIVAAGFQPIRNLTGHGLGRWKVHTLPAIPNSAERGGPLLRTGMVFAIEPFSCTGKGYVFEQGKSEVFMMVQPPKREKGYDAALLADILSWNGLPFARRYFADHDPAVLERTINKLARQKALVRYPPLVEEQGVMVAQTEHTIYLGPEGPEVLTA
jgi:methionyl aminopeptidase